MIPGAEKDGNFSLAPVRRNVNRLGANRCYDKAQSVTVVSNLHRMVRLATRAPRGQAAQEPPAKPPGRAWGGARPVSRGSKECAKSYPAPVGEGRCHACATPGWRRTGPGGRVQAGQVHMIVAAWPARELHAKRRGHSRRPARPLAGLNRRRAAPRRQSTRSAGGSGTPVPGAHIQPAPGRPKAAEHPLGGWLRYSGAGCPHSAGAGPPQGG